MKASCNRFVQIISGLILSITILCASINFVLIYKPLYYYDIENLNISASAGISNEDIRQNYSLLIDYLNSNKIDKLALPSFNMSRETETHFKEVKNIFILIKNLMFIFVILSLISVLLNIIKRNYLFMKYTSIILIVIPLLIIPTALNFNKSFTIFHKIFFHNDYWLIDPNIDPIINIFPEEFFMHCMIMILSIILASSIILYLLYRTNNKRCRT